MGRTTSLVLTALQLVRMGKKVILVDFDLEAPGLATLLLPENGEYPKYGVIDYFLESHIYIKSDNKPDIDEYLYTVYDSVLTGTNGGQLYVMPAANMKAIGVENYLEKISRIDFGTPQYLQNDNPINRMLFQITEQFSPDLIFLDARTGINDLGGLTLTRLSNIGVLLFYGNEQNVMGMDIVLPKVIESGIPFFLINSLVPLSEGESREEEDFFLKNAYRIFVASGAYDENALPDLYEKSADHYPFTVEYNPNAVFLNTTSKIINLLAYGGRENVYWKLAEEISAHAPER